MKKIISKNLAILILGSLAVVATACSNPPPVAMPSITQPTSPAPTLNNHPSASLVPPSNTQLTPSPGPLTNNQPSISGNGPEPGPTHQTTVFSHPLTIDNKWTPMVPGTVSYFAGAVSQGKYQESHGIISIVTDLTKVIDGVNTAVMWERDFSNGLLAESELFFVAQDDLGAVWLFGEYPAIYEKGQFTGAPDTWISGTSGTQGGIFMAADPRLSSPSYSQGYAPSVQFYDRAEISNLGQSVCTSFDCFHDVLVIDEWSPLAPEDGHQFKYYASGVGTVFVIPKGGIQQETLSLVTVTHLNQTDMVTVRQEVLKLDTDAYHVSKVYAQTSPAVPRP